MMQLVIRLNSNKKLLEKKTVFLFLEFIDIIQKEIKEDIAMSYHFNTVLKIKTKNDLLLYKNTHWFVYELYCGILMNKVFYIDGLKDNKSPYLEYSYLIFTNERFPPYELAHSYRKLKVIL